MILSVEMTEAEIAALSLVAVDVQEWADNALTARAKAALHEAKQQPAWSDTLASAVQSGIDVTDDGAVLLHGVNAGIIKTAAQKHAEAVLAAGQAPAGGIPANVVPTTISDRQFFQGCALRGLCSEAEALEAVKTGTLPAQLEAFVTALPADQRFGARMVLSGAVSFNRSSPLTEAFGQMAGMTPAQVDEFWRFCAGL